jgi:glucokinase
MKKYIIGVDLGGTKIATVLTDTCGKVLGRSELATQADRGQEAVIQNVFMSVDTVLAETCVPTKEVIGLGIGSPGPLDAQSGVVLEAPNLGWENVPIRDILQERYSVPVYLENDATLDPARPR